MISKRKKNGDSKHDKNGKHDKHTDLAEKIFKTLYQNSSKYGPTCFANIRKYLEPSNGLTACSRCSKKMTRFRKHNCVQTMNLRHLQKSWPRFRSKLFCVFACKGSYTDYRQLAEHYLEHNWADLKFFGYHPQILHQVVNEEDLNPKTRKRAKSGATATMHCKEIWSAKTSDQTGPGTPHFEIDAQI